MQVEEIQADLLPPMPDSYASLANKLREMAIEDAPLAKKPRTCTPESGFMAEQHGENMEEQEPEVEDPPQRKPLKTKFVRRVSTLLELCIGMSDEPFLVYPFASGSTNPMICPMGSTD